MARVIPWATLGCMKPDASRPGCCPEQRRRMALACLAEATGLLGVAVAGTETSDMQHAPGLDAWRMANHCSLATQCLDTCKYRDSAMTTTLAVKVSWVGNSLATRKAKSLSLKDPLHFPMPRR